MRTRNPPKLIMNISLIMQLIMSCLVFQCAAAGPERAQWRSIRLHLMPPLMARIERQLMRGIWAAVDRPSPTNWRRTVAKRAPHRTASLTGYTLNGPQIGPKSILVVILRGTVGVWRPEGWPRLTGWW